MISFLPGSAEADPIRREGKAEAMPGPVAARGRALQEPTRSRGAGGEEPGGPHGQAARAGNAHGEGAEVRGNGTRSPPREERSTHRACCRPGSWSPSVRASVELRAAPRCRPPHRRAAVTLPWLSRGIPEKQGALSAEQRGLALPLPAQTQQLACSSSHPSERRLEATKEISSLLTQAGVFVSSRCTRSPISCEEQQPSTARPSPLRPALPPGEGRATIHV